jgi:hypothetical protein
MIEIINPLTSILRKIWKKGWNTFTQCLFLDAYKVSDEEYWKSQILTFWKKEWHSLSGFLDFKLLLPYSRPGRDECNILFIKTKIGTNFDKVSIAITAYSDHRICKYQETISLYDVNEVPFAIKLENIPLRGIKIINDRIYTSFDKISITVKELYRKKEDNINLATSCEEIITYPLYTDLMNDDFQKKWGKYYNVDCIKECKAQIFRSYRFHLVYSHFLYKSYTDKIRRFFMHPLYLLLTNNYVTNLVFWSRNIFTAKQLRKSIAESKDETFDSIKE